MCCEIVCYRKVRGKRIKAAERTWLTEVYGFRANGFDKEFNVKLGEFRYLDVTRGQISIGARLYRR